MIELDTTLTPELILEGLRNELVHHINGLRKTSGLSISDKAHLTAPKYLYDVIGYFQQYIESEALVERIAYGNDWLVQPTDKQNPPDLGIQIEEEVEVDESNS